MANRLTLTPEKKAQFIEHVRATCNVSAAARKIGHSRRYLYEVRETDKEFAVAWDDAVEEALDNFEAEISRRAFDGVDEPVFYKGDECGTIRKFSDGLAMFFLKAYREKFRDKTDVEVTLKGDLAKRILQSRQRAGSE